ncbi:MAG: hypothetical protein JJ895_11795 [Balneolaceae bacterium]|nr:hypothetical protein [Balneolaceae bacterium]
MRAINIYWTFITLLLVSTNISAQKSATAVMNVSVTVVSGVTLSEVNSVDINFDNNTVTEGGFEITTPKHLDADISNQESVVITNQFGESITINSDSTSSVTDDVHSIKLGANFGSELANLRGTYEGTLTTTITYF